MEKVKIVLADDEVLFRKGISFLIQREPNFEVLFEASNGEEIFLSVENPDSGCLIGYVRLRIPSEQAHRKEIVGKNAGLIREIHVLGPLVPVGEKDPLLWQHRGYGTTLLNKAEEIALNEYNCKKMLVTSALGSRRYFMKLGYSLEGPYMSKKIQRYDS